MIQRESRALMIIETRSPGSSSSTSSSRVVIAAARAIGSYDSIMTLKSRMRPPNPIHPGRMLQEEFLAPAGVSQRAMAKRLGWTFAKLNELINGKRGITADSALDLAAELGTSPELWLNLQMYFDLHRAQMRRRKAS